MEPISRTIETWDKTKLFTQTRERGSSCWIIWTHGIGEHLGRHEYLQNIFGSDLNIFQYDLRGHGNSSGEKAFVQDFEYYIKDLSEIITYLKTKYDAKRVILFGHSMGALITLGYIQNMREHDDVLEGIVVNAPPLGFPGPLGKLMGVLSNNIVSKIAKIDPSIPLGGLVDLGYLSHDKTVKEAYLKDPLNHLRIHSKLLFQMVTYSKKLGKSPIKSPCPLYCSYGTEDGIIDVDALEKYFKNVEKNADLFPIEGGFHELHLETDRYNKPYFEYLKKTIDKILYK